MPVVFTYSPSARPRSTTFVSPAISITPFSRAASAIAAMTRSSTSHRKSLLEHEAGRQEARPRAHHRQVVERAVHGERADVAAGKLERAHDEGVGGHRDLAAVDGHDRGVAELPEDGVVEQRQEAFAEQGRAHLAAGAVAQLDAIGRHQRHRAGRARVSIVAVMMTPPPARRHGVAISNRFPQPPVVEVRRARTLRRHHRRA